MTRRVASNSLRRQVVVLALLCLLLVTGNALVGQTQTTAPPEPTSDQDTSRPRSRPDTSPTATNIDSGKPLPALLSPLHWGRLSIVSFSAAEFYQTNAYLSADNTLQQQQVTSFQALLSYLIDRGGFQFNIQYRPQLWMANDGLQTDLADHAFTLGTSRKPQLGRWSTAFAVNFSSSSQRSQAMQYAMSPAALVNLYNRNAYVVNGGRATQAASSLTLDRALGNRDHLSFGVDYSFLQVKAPNGQQGAFVGGSRQHAPGGNIGWSHAAGWRSTFGLHYSYGMFLNGGDIDNHYQHHTIMADFSFEPARDLRISLSGGPALSVRPPAANVSDRIARSYQSSVSVTRKFRQSEFAVTYGRDDAFRGIIGDSFNNHVDIAYGQTLGRRWGLSLGGSYLRQSAGATDIQSWRGSAQLSFNVSRSWSLYSGYSYLDQSGLPVLNRIPSHFVSGGIRWSWSPAPAARK